MLAYKKILTNNIVGTPWRSLIKLIFNGKILIMYILLRHGFGILCQVTSKQSDEKKNCNKGLQENTYQYSKISAPLHVKVTVWTWKVTVETVMVDFQGSNAYVPTNTVVSRIYFILLHVKMIKYEYVENYYEK